MTDTTEVTPAPQMLDLDAFVPALITWVNNKYSANSSKVYRKRFGISNADWRVLAYLGVKDTGTGAQMSEFLGMDKAAISRSVHLLTERSYVRVAQREGRRSNLRLTTKGVKLYNSVLVVALEREAALLKGFSDIERTALLKLLHKMHGNVPEVITLHSEFGG